MQSNNMYLCERKFHTIYKLIGYWRFSFVHSTHLLVNDAKYAEKLRSEGSSENICMPNMPLSSFQEFKREWAVCIVAV